jgi:hypothetical protein
MYSQRWHPVNWPLHLHKPLRNTAVVAIDEHTAAEAEFAVEPRVHAQDVTIMYCNNGIQDATIMYCNNGITYQRPPPYLLNGINTQNSGYKKNSGYKINCAAAAYVSTPACTNPWALRVLMGFILRQGESV